MSATVKFATTGASSAARVAQAYHRANAALTRRLLRELEACGPDGMLGASLFRAQKSSTRAKCYRGGLGTGSGRRSYTELAYRRKGEALAALGLLLARRADLPWGWGEDQGQPVAPWVLYLELPGVGQVSFHSPERGEGPDYHSGWDGARCSEERVLAYCAGVLDRAASQGDGHGAVAEPPDKA